MIVVQLPNKLIGISFKHIFTMTMVRGVKQKARITHCAIFEIPADEKEPVITLTTGVAKCSTSDNFSKAKGRKVSLTRALLVGDHEFNNIAPDGTIKEDWAEIKATRELIWLAYLNRGKTSVPDSGTPILDGVLVEEQKLLPALLEETPAVVH